MSRKWRSILIVALFLVTIPVWVVLAWDGSRVALIALAVTASFLAVLSGYLQYHWSETLDSWRTTLDRWGTTTKYSEEQARIMHDALTDLAEHDTEAAYIHSGRIHTAVSEYAENFREEEADG